MSTVVIVGLMFQFVDLEGWLTTIIANFTGERPVILTNPRAFRPMYIISGIWQNLGWGSIIYLAALTGINPELYESADIDGTNRFQKIVFITLPTLLPTILILFILNTRQIVEVGSRRRSSSRMLRRTRPPTSSRPTSTAVGCKGRSTATRLR